jgi:replicative DNA helicase
MWPTPRVLSTAKIMAMLTRQRYQNRLWLETFSGHFGAEESGAASVDPWLLGALLGDGSLSGSSLRFSTASEEFLEKVRSAIGEEMSISYAGKYDYRIIRRDGANVVGVQGVAANPITRALRAMGLWERDATNKFIPVEYMNASRASRLRLLSGLIDADGWVESFGAIRIATSSRRLADDIVQLTRSLGGTAGHYPKTPTYSYRGEQLEGKQSYVCNLCSCSLIRRNGLPPGNGNVD